MPYNAQQTARTTQGEVSVHDSDAVKRDSPRNSDSEIPFEVEKSIFFRLAKKLLKNIIYRPAREVEAPPENTSETTR